MKKIHCGCSGTNTLSRMHKLSDLPIEQYKKTALISFFRGDMLLRPAQEVSIFQHDLLDTKDNVILSTPTNSGKSLLSYLLALQQANLGGTVILIEPLRALAQEKYDELREIARLVRNHGGPKIKISITTGDYRLNDEFMGSSPGYRGKSHCAEIIVATPERLDAISRMPKHREWFKNINLVCIDEAHLISDDHRGATLELFIAFLRSIETRPQLVLLSATVSNSEDLAKWLNPCVVIQDVPRYPVLEKWLIEVDEEEDVNQILISEVSQVLKKEDTSVLIFVYRTDWAESLACSLASSLYNAKIKKGDLQAATHQGIAWYHAGMSNAAKNTVKQELSNGKVRVVVSTTALAMGINLPTTHVFVRDITFPGVKELDTAELTQMLGRAGRGNRTGIGIVFHRNSDKMGIRDLEDGLRNEDYPHLRSRLVPHSHSNYYGKKGDNTVFLERVGNQILGILNRTGSITLASLENYLSHTWGGKEFVNGLKDLLQKLQERKLVFQNENTREFELTSLGKTTSRCYLPSGTAANIGQLIRDLLQDEPSGVHFKSLNPIDLLLILCLTSTELRPIARYSKALEAQVSNYMEGLPLNEKSYLYRKWLSTDASALLGSSRIDGDLKPEEAHKVAHQSAYLAMFLYDLSKGIATRDLESRYKINVEEIEEKLTDTILWLLYGLEKVLEVRNFYYHLRSVCDISREGIRSIDIGFKRLSRMIFALLPNLRFKSSLGEIIRGVKRAYPNSRSYPGEGTVRKLHENGINSLKDLVNKGKQDLLKMEINPTYVDMLLGYVRRRLQ